MSKKTVLWLAILLVAFAARLLAATYWHHQAQGTDSPFRLGDSLSYWTLAEHIARLEPYEYGGPDASIFRAPLYPLLLAPLTYIGDLWQAVWLARVVGCLLGALTVYLLGKLTAICFSERAAALAGMVAALYPSAIGMSITVLAEALFMPLFLGYLCAWAKASQSKELHVYPVIAGFLAGLAVLARPSLLLFLPGCIVAALIVLPNRPKQFRITTIILLVVCCTMSPWWARNASVTGKFVPTTLQVGPSLRDGLHANATGASDTGMSFMDDTYRAQVAADANSKPGALESTLEWRVNRRAMTEATSWAQENPGRVFKLAGQKFMRTWSLWPDGGELGSTTVRAAITLTSFGVFTLAVLATLMLATGRIASIAADQGQTRLGALWLCWLPCLYFTALHMVFVGSIRYREPAVFVLIALAAVTVSNSPHLLTRRKQESQSKQALR